MQGAIPGVVVSKGLSPAGSAACECLVHSDLLEPMDITSVLTIGLFDGIGGLRVAADALGWNVAGHVSVECQAACHRIVESHFPQVWKVTDVSWSMRSW